MKTITADWWPRMIVVYCDGTRHRTKHRNEHLHDRVDVAELLSYQGTRQEERWDLITGEYEQSDLWWWGVRGAAPAKLDSVPGGRVVFRCTAESCGYEVRDTDMAFGPKAVRAGIRHEANADPSWLAWRDVLHGYLSRFADDPAASDADTGASWLRLSTLDAILRSKT